MAKMDAGGEEPVRFDPRPRTDWVLSAPGVAVVVLYGSLKFLHGSVCALLAGLALGVAALTIESLRLLRSWTL